jgi:SAM-dependent methyltransferase
VSERDVRRKVEEARAGGDPTGWFEPLYAAASAGEGVVPWDRGAPRALLVEWAQLRRPQGRTALVVGCGLGFDAEYVAGLGFATVAFDVSATAIEMARERHPGSRVDYRVADLLGLPAQWEQAFDLVVECLTVQSLPPQHHAAASASVAAMVAPGGTLIVIATAAAGAPGAPPWPLTREEIDAFAVGGVQIRSVEHIPGELPHWRAELCRPAILRE